MYTKQIFIHVWVPDKDEPVDTPVTLRKWSGAKLITLFGDVGEIGKALQGDISIEKIMAGNQAEILRLVEVMGVKAVQRIANLVCESLLKPKLTIDDVLQWDLDDLIAAVTEVVRMNCAPDSRKNFFGLRDAFKDAIEGVVEAARADNGIPAASRT